MGCKWLTELVDAPYQLYTSENGKNEEFKPEPVAATLIIQWPGTLLKTITLRESAMLLAFQ